MTESNDKIALLTWSPSSIKYTRLYPSPNIIFSAEVSSSPTGFKSNDKGGKKLAQELNKKAISVQVELRRVGRESSSKPDTYFYDLELLLTSGKENVLLKLWEQFGDEIKFSVCLSTNRVNPLSGEHEVLSAEQMDIKSGRCMRRLSVTREVYTSIFAELTVKIYVPDNLHGTYGSKLTSHQLELDEAQTTLEDPDLVIYAGNGAEIKAHRAFLSASSPVLRATFKNKMKETLTRTLDMTDMPEESVKAFLRYVNSGDVTDAKADVEIAYDLLCAAHKYHIPKLESMMVLQLLQMDDKEFKVELAFTIYSFIRLWDSHPTLKKKMIWILITNWSKVKKLPAYQELKKNPDLAMEFSDEFVQENASSFLAELLKNGVPLPITASIKKNNKKKNRDRKIMKNIKKHTRRILVGIIVHTFGRLLMYYIDHKTG